MTVRTSGRPGAMFAPGRARNLPRHRMSAAAAAVLCMTLVAGCVPSPMLATRGGLDSLRVAVDTLVVRDAIAYELIKETRREVAEQRDILLSTRATSGSTTQELFEQMGRLEGKLDEVMGRFQQIRATGPVPAAGTDPRQLYDQATQDLTQGRYALALENFRDFVARDALSDLADNAQYGIGESFFAQSHFDSAATEYAKVETLAPQGDKVPAALYKMALSKDKLGQAAESKQTLESLVKRYPLSGEAQLARERLGTPRRR